MAPKLVITLNRDARLRFYANNERPKPRAPPATSIESFGEVIENIMITYYVLRRQQRHPAVSTTNYCSQFNELQTVSDVQCFCNATHQLIHPVTLTQHIAAHHTFAEFLSGFGVFA